MSGTTTLAERMAELERLREEKTLLLEWLGQTAVRADRLQDAYERAVEERDRSEDVSYRWGARHAEEHSLRVEAERERDEALARISKAVTMMSCSFPDLTYIGGEPTVADVLAVLRGEDEG